MPNTNVYVQMAGPDPSDVPYAAEFEHVATKHCRTLTPAVVDDNMHKASQAHCYLRDKQACVPNASIFLGRGSDKDSTPSPLKSLQFLT